MKLLADENVSGVLVEELRARGVDVLWVKTHFRGISDDVVIDLASAEGRVVLTSDKGFGEQVFHGGRRVGVILLRLYDVDPTNWWRLSRASSRTATTGTTTSA